MLRFESMTARLKRLFTAALVLLSFSSTPAFSIEASAGLWSVIGEYIGRIAGNIDYIEIDSTDAGFDRGAIAKVIFGVSRVVERNPKSTAADDRYLVKDTMRIGLRLGAGLMLSGSGSYVRQYTLVYPVSKKLAGTFHDKFILNLLLPANVIFNKLPKKYVLMTESFVEGQGRLKIGGNALIPLGSATSYGKVQLSRTFIDYKSDKKVKVFIDKAKYSQLTQLINFNFGLLGIPIFKSRLDKGHLERTYLEVDISDKDKRKKASQALGLLVKEDSHSELGPLSTPKKLKTDFIENYDYFTLAWLFTVEGVNRIDRITEITNNGERDEYVTRFQVEDRRMTSWTTGIDAETHSSKLWAMARGKDETGYIDPEVRITLVTTDDWLKGDEIKERYESLIDKIAFKKNFMNLQKSFTDAKNRQGKLHMQIDMQLYSEAFEILLNTSAASYWASLAAVTGEAVSYFKEASNRNLHSHAQRRIRQGRVSLSDMYLARAMKSFIRRVQLAKNESDPLIKMRWLILALRRVTYVGPGTFSPVIFQMIHALVGEENLFIKFQLTNLILDSAIKDGFKHKLVTKTIGRQRVSQNKLYPFLFQDTSEIYYLF